VAAFVLLAVGACAGADDGPWPGGYRSTLCSVLGHLLEADAALAPISQALEAQDPDGVGLGAAAMQREAAAARAMLAEAEPWDPGAALVGAVTEAAEGYRQAAVLFSRGARQGNGPAIDDGVVAVRSAAAAWGSAIAAERTLARYGWQPC
jgi:hypothetical protein